MGAERTINLSALGEPDYPGSVQHLYFVPDDPGVMVCRTTAGGSVFDVGTIFSITGSDVSRAAVRHAVFSRLRSPAAWQRLGAWLAATYTGQPRFLEFISSGLLERFQSQGAPTHHLGMIDADSGRVVADGFPARPSPCVLVERFSAIRPKRVVYGDARLWDYSVFRDQDGYVVPLENIVRFGVTSASSIHRKFRRLSEAEQRTFLQELGLERLPAWALFPAPVVDFTTKYEPEDRPLKDQEALYISGLDGGDFLDLVRMSLLGSFIVRHFFQELDLTLWDIKWEIARRGGELLFVDTIDTDSIRVTRTIADAAGPVYVHFNKQAMRDYYRILHGDWYGALDVAKAEAARRGESFKVILEAGQRSGLYPPTPVVDEAFLAIQARKFRVLLDHVLTAAGSAGTAREIESIARDELAFYRARGEFDAFFQLNGLRE